MKARSRIPELRGANADILVYIRKDLLVQKYVLFLNSRSVEFLDLYPT